MKNFISKLTPKDETISAPIPVPIPAPTIVPAPIPTEPARSPTEPVPTPTIPLKEDEVEKKPNFIEADLEGLYGMFSRYVKEYNKNAKKRRKPVYVSESDSSDSSSDSEPVQKIRKNKSYYKRKYKQIKSKGNYNPPSQQAPVSSLRDQQPMQRQPLPTSSFSTASNAQGASSSRLTVNAGNLPLRRQR